MCLPLWQRAEEMVGHLTEQRDEMSWRNPDGAVVLDFTLTRCRIFSLLSCCSAFVQHRCFHQTLFVLLWDLGGCNNRPYCSDCGFPVADVCIPLSTTVSPYLCSNLLLFHLLTSKSKWLQYIYSIYVFKNQLFFIISRTSVDFVGWILWMRIEDHLKEKLWLNTGHLNKLLWILVN